MPLSAKNARLASITGAALTAMLFACSQNEGSTDTSSRPQSCVEKPKEMPPKQFGIVGGTFADDSLRQSQSSVALILPKKVEGSATPTMGTICTGVILSENIVITAAHCFVNVTSETEATPNLRLQVLFSDKVNGGVAPDERRFAAAFGKHPGFLSRGFNDIAWIKLDRGIPPGYRPALVLTDLSELRGGISASLIGYGSTSSKDGSTTGLRRIVTSQIDKPVSPLTFPGTLFFNLVRLLSQGSGACFGDSGGPAFMLPRDELDLRVFGITQGTLPGVNITANGTNPCESGDVNYTMIAPYLDWIESSSGINITPPDPSHLIVLDNIPAARSNQSALDIRVAAGSAISHYKVAILSPDATGSLDCNAATVKYSDFRTIDKRITETIGNDGLKRICVIGRTGTNDTTEPVSYSWVKDGSVQANTISNDYSGLRSNMDTSTADSTTASCKEQTIKQDSPPR